MSSYASCICARVSIFLAILVAFVVCLALSTFIMVLFCIMMRSPKYRIWFGMIYYNRVKLCKIVIIYDLLCALVSLVFCLYVSHAVCVLLFAFLLFRWLGKGVNECERARSLTRSLVCSCKIYDSKRDQSRLSVGVPEWPVAVWPSARYIRSCLLVCISKYTESEYQNIYIVWLIGVFSPFMRLTYYRIHFKSAVLVNQHDCWCCCCCWWWWWKCCFFRRF